MVLSNVNHCTSRLLFTYGIGNDTPMNWKIWWDDTWCTNDTQLGDPLLISVYGMLVGQVGATFDKIDEMYATMLLAQSLTLNEDIIRLGRMLVNVM